MDLERSALGKKAAVGGVEGCDEVLAGLWLGRGEGGDGGLAVHEDVDLALILVYKLVRI
jgi:hypothetical protein